jgi:hypothetical protein
MIGEERAQRITGQTEMLLPIAPKKGKEVAAVRPAGRRKRASWRAVRPHETSDVAEPPDGSHVARCSDTCLGEGRR